MKNLIINNVKVSDLTIPISCGIQFPAMPYTLETIGITQSLLSKWQTCRKSFLIAINRYQSLKKELKTGYGSLIHDVLEYLYTGFVGGKFKYNDFIDAIDYSINRFKFNSKWTMQAVEIAKAKAQAILENYIIVFKNDFTELQFESVEDVFNISFSESIIRGKRDLVIIDKKGNKWNLEHKNFGQINEETITFQLNFNLQNLIYLIAGEQIDKCRINGTVQNILRNPQIRKKLKPDELYKELKIKIAKEPDHYFYRYWVPYSRKQILNFKRELSIKLSELNSTIATPLRFQNRLFYRNENACCGTAYTCDYLEACANDCLNGYIQTDKIFPELS